MGSGRAALARWCGDLTVAEDAVQEAFAETMSAWSHQRAPDNPGRWIVKVAHNRALDRFRHESARPGKDSLPLTALDDATDDPRLSGSATVASIRADLLRRAGRPSEAAHWYRIALHRNGSGLARDFLRRRLAEVS